MIDGKMCCGVVKTNLMVRLAPEEVARGLAQPHTRPMDFTGKPMKSMLYVEAAGTDSDEALKRWVESAHAFVGALERASSRRRSRGLPPSARRLPPDNL